MTPKQDYGVPEQIGLEPTPEAYVERLVGVFREVRRVLRDAGTPDVRFRYWWFRPLSGSRGGDRQDVTDR